MTKIIFKQDANTQKLIISSRRTIESHVFNAKISFISSKSTALTSNYHYYTLKTTLLQLVNSAFIEQCKSSKVYALETSENTLIWIDRSILNLRVTRDVYTSLGLMGTKGKTGMYSVSIDLAHEDFAPGNKNYDRVFWSFSNHLTLEYEFYICAISSEGSLDIPFPNATLNRSSFTYSRLQNVLIPSINHLDIGSFAENAHFTKDKGNNQGLADATNLKNMNSRQTPLDLYEWIGLALIQSPRIATADDVDPFICIHDTFEPSYAGDCFVGKMKGFMPYEVVEGLLDVLKGSVAVGDMSIIDNGDQLKDNWSIVSTVGFSHAPISWNQYAREWCDNAPTGCAFVMNSIGDSVVFQAVGSDDTFS